MTEPEHRPGAELDTLDSLSQREDRPPDKSGRDWGLTWCAWRQWPSDSNRYGKIKVYIAGPDGELIQGLQMRSYDRQRKVDYHTVETWRELHERLWRMYWNRVRDDSDPIEDDVQEVIQRRKRKQAREEYWQQRAERERGVEVRTERVNGTTRSWIEDDIPRG